MSKFYEMTFDKSTYENESEMWNDIRDFIRIILKQDYMFKMYCDEQGFGIYVIQYNYKDDELSGAALEWLGENEYIETEGCPENVID